jgi:uncharacterized protein
LITPPESNPAAFFWKNRMKRKSISPRIALALFAAVSFSACDDDQAPPAPIAAKPAVPLTGCGAKATAISEIQGDDPQSAMLGKIVSIQATVTFAPTANLGGLFVQEEKEDRDGEPATSEGLFIHSESAKAKPGDVVRVTGAVVELGEVGKTLTALSDVSEFLTCGQDKLPTEANIETAPLVAGDWERYESMRVHLDLPVTVIRNDNLQRAGELMVSLNGRQFTPTQIHPPGEEARKLLEDHLRSRIILDDASLAQFPNKLWIPLALSQDAPYRLGTRLGEVMGVLDERAGSYRIHVLSTPVAEQAPRPKQAPVVKGELKVASFNTLNWFNGDGKRGGFPTARGARELADAERQRSKLVAAIGAIKPDIAALMEIENDGDEKLNALAELVNAINRETGLGYAAIASPEPKLGGDQIRVALIYRSKIVQPKGASAALVGPPFENYNRVPLAQSFQHGKSGGVFTIVTNHFKSKSCNGADESNVDRGDGQACFNPKRVEAARALMTWLKTDPTKSGDPDVLIVGDLNAYAKEDPIRLLVDGGYMLLAEGKTNAPEHSFAWDGMLGSLDHALASETLKSQVQDAEIWHINSEEYVGFAYDSAIAPPVEGSEETPEMKNANTKMRTQLYRKTPFRSSDHDPLIIGLTLEK